MIVKTDVNSDNKKYRNIIELVIEAQNQEGSNSINV